MERKNRGYLFIAIIVIIVVVAFIGLAVVHVLTVQSSAETQQIGSKQALYAAESGIESALFNIKQQATQTALNTYCDDSLKSKVTVGNAEYEFKCKTYVNSAKLKNAISDSDKIIPIKDLSGSLAPFGRVQIESEKIAYSATSGEESVCGTGKTPCLVVSERGSNGTTPVPHALDVVVSQNQVNINSKGAVPDIDATKKLGEKELSKVILVTFPSGYKHLWAVGEKGAIYRKDAGSDTWEKDEGVAGLDKELYGVACAGVDDCYAVGEIANLGGGDGQMYHWDGSQWSGPSAVTQGGSVHKLQGVACSSSSRCWAVDDQGYIYMGHGSSWAVEGSKGDDQFTDITCPTADRCVAVGQSGYIRIGSNLSGGSRSWATIQTSSGESLWGVSCPVDSTDMTGATCWGVGDSGVVVEIENNSIASTTYPIGDQLVSVSCGDTNNCWATTKEKQKSARYQGGGWASADNLNIPDLGDGELHDVYCLDPDECFIVADRQNNDYALIGGWDGLKWKKEDVEKVESGDEAQNMIAIAAEKSTSSAPTITDIGWREDFN